MDFLFAHDICDWSSWGKVFQSIDAWQPLILYIFQKENIPCEQIENLTPGTNAVFKVDEYVVKIFAPKESGMEVGTDYCVELFGLERANRLGISAPKLVGGSTVDDKYQFRYMIMEFVHGNALGKIENGLSYNEKLTVGRNLREITDKLNTPCEPFHSIDVLTQAIHNDGWAHFPASFIKERLAFLADYHIDENEKVYCHGDLNPDNIFVDDKLELCIIDFADAMLAPENYEQALIACELFCFEKPYMLGYFGEYKPEYITELCMNGLLIHDSGSDTLRCNIGPAEEITSLAVMRERLYNLVKMENEKYYGM
jgi:serine/threonine protein kinase